jgi:hypothetical protein
MWTKNVTLSFEVSETFEEGFDLEVRIPPLLGMLVNHKPHERRKFEQELEMAVYQVVPEKYYPCKMKFVWE